MTIESPPNMMTAEYNVAALAAARLLVPEIPETALPIIFMSAIEIYPDPDEAGEAYAKQHGYPPDDADLLDIMRSGNSLMWMPKGYVGVGFADYNGEVFGEKRWYVALKVDDLPQQTAPAPQAQGNAKTA